MAHGRSRLHEIRAVCRRNSGLETRLTPELRQRVESLLSRNQLDPAPMMRMKPWMLANVLALFEAAQAGYVPGLSVEAYCYAWRRPTASPFLNSKASSSSSSFTKRRRGRLGYPFLEEAIKAVESRAARRELNRIVQAWETADRGSLERLLVEMRAQSSVGSRFTVDTILLGRHPQMVRKIEMMMAQRQAVRICGRCAASGRPARAGRIAASARLHADGTVTAAAGRVHRLNYKFRSVTRRGPCRPGARRSGISAVGWSSLTFTLEKPLHFVRSVCRCPRRNDLRHLSRLGDLIDRMRPTTIVFLGDLFHAREAHAVSTLAALHEWRERHAALDLVWWKVITIAKPVRPLRRCAFAASPTVAS